MLSLSKENIRKKFKKKLHSPSLLLHGKIREIFHASFASVFISSYDSLLFSSVLLDFAWIL